MKRFDMHCHADSGSAKDWDALAAAARESETVVAVVGEIVDVGMNGFRKLVLDSDGHVTWPHLIGRAQHLYHELLDRIGVPRPVVAQIMGRTAASWIGIELEDEN